MSMFDPTDEERRRGLDLAMTTFPAGWERDSLARRATQALVDARLAAVMKPAVPKPVVRVTIEYADGRGMKVINFTDLGEANSFLVNDSYVTEPYVRKLTWENLA